MQKQRITIAKVLVAIALIASLLGADQTWRRRHFCLQQVQFHESQLREARGKLVALETSRTNRQKQIELALAKKQKAVATVWQAMADEATFGISFFNAQIHAEEKSINRWRQLAIQPWKALPQWTAR